MILGNDGPHDNDLKDLLGTVEDNAGKEELKTSTGGHNEMNS